MINYGAHSIDEDDINSVERVLRSNWLTQGPAVLEFEKALAKKCGARYAVAVANGTAALHLAYLVAGLKKGDEVITTPNTFVATSNMILAVGARPVFCDIRPDTNNIDEVKIEKLITKKTKAIAPVDFGGHPCEYRKIMLLSKKYKLLVIEDGAHALGAEYRGRKVGSIADMTTFSFHPVKPITTGEGGAILTNNETFYRKLLLLRSHGIKKDKNGFNVMTEMGYNYRLNDIQAGLGLSQLKKLKQFTDKRRKVVSWYSAFLGGNKNIILPKEIGNCRSSWHLFVIKTKKSADRMPLFNYLKDNGIGVNFHYPAVYSHPFYQKNSFSNIHCPNMDLYHRSAITIPIYPRLKRDNVKKICHLIDLFFDKLS